MKFGMAIQSLAGRNMFSAGVLYNLRQKNITPEIITTTAGGLYCLNYYLDENKDALRGMIKENLLPNEYLFWKTLLFGVPGGIRPLTTLEYLNELTGLMSNNFLNHTSNIIPAPIFKSDIPSSFFESLCDKISRSSIGIICNAYNYKEAKTIVYINPAANKLLHGTRFSLEPTWDKNQFEVKTINPDGIRACLQCVEYGETYMDQYEGAYQYNPLIAPLKKCKNIYIIAAVPFKKPDKPIKTLLDAYCFKMKMLFHNAIYSEVSNIELLNHLIQNNVITSKDFHEINVKILEPTHEVDFFDYFNYGNKPLFEDGVQSIEHLKNKHLEA